MSTFIHPYYKGATPWRFAVQVTTPPAALPVPLSLARAQCNIEPNNTIDDEQLTFYLNAACEDFQRWTGCCLVTQTLTMTSDDFPYPFLELYIPNFPIQSITSLTYLDSGGNVTTVPTSVYSLDNAMRQPKLYLKWAQFWPPQRPIQNAIRLTFVAGYGTLADSPQTIPYAAQRAILLLTEHYYSHRAAYSDGIDVSEVPTQIRQAVGDFRLSWL